MNAGTKITSMHLANSGTEMWHALEKLSSALPTYFALAEEYNAEALEMSVTMLDEDSLGVKGWREQIRRDHQALLRSADFQGHSDPTKLGFMNLQDLVVSALVDVAGLTWGGMYAGGKDIMHFDWRSGPTITR